MLKILLDENISYEIIPFLEKFGYYVEHIKKIGKTGIKNGEVYQLAISKEMWIITRDTDFLNIIKFSTYDVKGIVVLKLLDTTTNNIKKHLKELIEFNSQYFTEKRLIQITDERIQIIQ